MKIIVIGQNGSGKTTLARLISEKQNAPLLEIDTIWHAMGIPSIRESDENTREKIKDHITNEITQFINQNQNWVCEGFYASSLKPAADVADQIIFLDIPLWRRQLNHIKRTVTLEDEGDFTLTQNLRFLFSMPARTRRTAEYLNLFLAEYKEKVVTLKSYKASEDWLNHLV